MKASEIKTTVSRMTVGEDFTVWRDNKIKEIETVYNSKIETLKIDFQKVLKKDLKRLKTIH